MVQLLVHNQHRSRSKGRDKLLGNRLLYLISASIIVVVAIQWRLATHHIQDLSAKTNFRSSLDSFITRSQRDIRKSNNLITRESNVLTRIYSAIEDVLPDEHVIDIPTLFTHVDEQSLHNGRVVLELSQRVLSRNIAQSNVVIVSPNFHQTHVYEEIPPSWDDTLSALYVPSKKALEQGHTTHLLPSTVNLGRGWIDVSSQKMYNSTSAGWILLAYFATQSFNTAYPTSTIDEILSPSIEGVESWLKHTTITYIVFPIQATATVQLSSVLTDEEYAYEQDYTVNKIIDMIGLQAAETLLRSNYKLQLLSSSHYFDALKEEQYYYGPNALFQNVKQLHRFLYQRITEVLTAEVRHLRKQRHNLRLTDIDDRVLEVQFHSLIFATQGLDLAIPSRFSYLDVGNHRVCKDANGNRKKKCDPKLHQRAQGDTIFLECPKRHSLIKVEFARGGHRWRDVHDVATKLEKTRDVVIDINNIWLTENDLATGEIEVWSGHEDPDKTEAFCVKTDKSSLLPSVACTTRVVPVEQHRLTPASKKPKPVERPNLLVVMIDPLSRQQRRRSLPNAWALMDLLGFIDFPEYTAVGKNSGPNQAALYSGAPLFTRDIRSSSNATERIWLWDRLRDAGYMTMKAEDACVSNSNMVQSIDPQTHHGKQLNEMFCFSYDRPNCLGEELAPAHLVNYTLQFIATYNGEKGKTPATSKPWAAFISFIDSHEDTSTLISYLDTLLVDFLQAVIKTAGPTMIVFTSDHGLHYGPMLESKSGLVEQVQPLLMMRLPSFQKSERSHMKQNADLFTTPFDVHETILDSLLQTSTSSGTHGASLLKALPKERMKCNSTSDIPANFCAIIEQNNMHNHSQCIFMTDPPSITSFYSSIPQANRPSWADQCPLKRTVPAEVDREHCLELQDSSYTLRSCGQHDFDKKLQLDIHVTRNEELVQKRKALLAKNRETNYLSRTNDLPNIIFLEIDSVSLSFSEKFFPKTNRLLYEHRIITQEGSNVCPTGWCAAAFNKTSVVGQSSIVNQLAALSGCTNQNEHNDSLNFFKPSTFCYHTDGKNSTKDNHWIFDIAKYLGYITFFGEEFCYDDSPYVVQTQTAFTLNEDLSPSKLFCDLAREWIRLRGEVNSKTVRTFDVDYDDKETSCFDGISRGEIAFTYISQMFDEYADMPKFAFVNALAAHDYSLDAAHMSLSAENYDTAVFEFLTHVMSRKSDRPTYIILRSDHGLQGGPYPVDYSTQIEHMHPWTAIIAPSSHTAISLDSLSSNQNRLATGFDIYKTLRYLMSSSKDELNAVGIPPWSYNILRETIPVDRSCQDARIPISFCPCNAERDDLIASFYVGHFAHREQYVAMPTLVYNWQTHMFVGKKSPGVSSPKLDMKYHVKSNTAVMRPNCNVTLGSYVDEDMVRDSWKMIEEITSMYPGSDVSGGIFLYPRQTILLSYLIQKEVSFMKHTSKKKKFKRMRICETGFGSGHSAALFLAASPDIEVVSFDFFDRPYQMASVNALNAFFGNRLTIIKGDSCVQVRRYSGICDFLHGSSLCGQDNIELIHKSDAGVTLTSTAMGSLRDKSVYFGKRPKGEVKKYGEHAQWATLYNKQCIEKIACFDEESRVLDANFVLARGKEQIISHKFCFAVNTGKCSSSNLSARESSWHPDDFCPEWRTVY